MQPLFPTKAVSIESLLLKRSAMREELSNILSLAQTSQHDFLGQVLTLDASLKDFTQKREWVIDAHLWGQMFQELRVSSSYRMGDFDSSVFLKKYLSEPNRPLSEIQEILPFTQENIDQFLLQYGTVSSEFCELLKNDFSELVRKNWKSDITERDGFQLKGITLNCKDGVTKKIPQTSVVVDSNSNSTTHYHLTPKYISLLLRLDLLAKHLTGESFSYSESIRVVTEKSCMDELSFGFSKIFKATFRDDLLIIYSPLHLDKILQAEYIEEVVK